jgi:hypothetical protein
LYVSSKYLMVSFLIEPGITDKGPVDVLSNVVAEDGGCDGFANGCFVRCLYGATLDVELGAVGGYAVEPGVGSISWRLW